MPKQAQAPQDTFQDVHFPLCGIDKSRAFGRQPNRQTQDGQFARTTPFGQNVRAYDPITGRARGAQRSGLVKYIPAQVSGTNAIQSLNCITGSGYSAPGGGVQTSSSGRVVTLVAVSAGNIKIADAGATSWTLPTGGTGALNSSGVLFAAPNNQKLYFVDGVNYVVYDPATNTVSPWTATAGSMPVGSDGGKARLITTWRGRSPVSGVFKDPQAIFFPKVGDPTNWDYSPLSPGPLDAIATTNGAFGLVGDSVTGLAPFNDDVLLIGCDHTLSLLRGDPLDGGHIYSLSDGIGMAWGQAWCRDPYGAIYFVSNRMGVYRLEINGKPQRISQQIEQLLKTVNTGSNTISLAWDDRFQGLHVFVTRTSGAFLNTHLFWEMRTGAWWTDQFANKNHNPLCATVFDGNEPDDRVTVLGSWDGYVRFLDPDATKDDGYDIASRVIIGPLLTKDMDTILLVDLLTNLSEESGDVSFSVLCGSTAEMALSSFAVEAGTWTAGRNDATYVNQSSHAIYIDLRATSPWALEQIRARIRGKGPVASRRSS